MNRSVEPGGWTALLSGQAAAQAVTVAVEIADAVEALPPADVGLSLAGGAAGFAVLNAHLALTLDDAAAAERAQTWLRRAIAGLRARPTAGLFAGAAGVGWAASHVTRLLGLEAKSLDPTTQINRALLTRLARSPCAAFDLVSGLTGYGVYALECLPTPGARACLEGVVSRLVELATHTPEGVTWHTGPELLLDHQRRQSPDGHHNLGVAHGVPGVLVILALAAAAGVARPQAAALASGAVDWLLAQRLDDTSPSRLPYWRNTDGSTTAPARTAWCYGDPGVAVAVLVAARALGVAAWEAEATGLARIAALRTPEDTGVTDASLCHGSAGLAHVFNRISQATGDGRIGEAARFWIQRTLDYREPGGGDFAGYPAPGGEGGEGSSLITGATGVALALLAAATATPPSWDRTLLASPIPD